MGVPTSWAEVTIGRFINIQDVIKVEKDPFERTVMILGAIRGMKKGEIEKVPIADLQADLRRLDFITTKLPEKIHADFKVQGRVFRGCMDISQINTTQYIELMEYAKSDPIHHIHEILAIMCDEYVDGVKLEYTSDRHKERAALFYDHLTIDVAYPQAVFFCKVWEGLMPITKTYLDKAKRELRKELRNLISSGGGGTSPSTSSQAAT